MKERIIVFVALIIFAMMMHPQRRGQSRLLSTGRAYFRRQVGQSVNA